ncbi:MAG: serine hydrolase, partial [Bacteroidota bacterium]
MKRIALFLLASSLYSFCLNGQNQDLLRKEINKIIRWDTEIDFERTPGFFVGIIDHDSSYYINYGPKETTAESIYEIGSISKPITASLISTLVNKGLINYHDLLNEFLPEIYRNDSFENLNIDQLLTHTSGLPR